MRALASLFCGFVFGCGLFISGMIMPTKVLDFLDVLAIPSGGWDPSLLVVMAVALVVSTAGYAMLRPRPAPLFDSQPYWPTLTTIDGPLAVGAVLFGIGWGLVGLCPGPAIENLASLSSGIVAFVVAMAVGMIAHDLWQGRVARAPSRDLAGATIADG
jgi:uncharacterized protein